MPFAEDRLHTKKERPMRTIFALFDSLEEAKAVVAELIDKRFDEGAMNAAVRIPTGQEGSDPGGGTGVSAEELPPGIEHLLLHGKSIPVADVGAIRAGGAIALTSAAVAAPDKRARGLEDLLVGLGVPNELAKFYRDGVAEGGILFWIRTETERAAEATNILSSARTEKLANYA